jgi:transposase
MPDQPLVNGATLVAVAAESRKRQGARHIRISKRWNVDDHVALDWIRQADEAGLDTGRPRDKPWRRPTL